MRRLLAAATAALTLATGAPSAHAAVVRTQCVLVATYSGQNMFTGVAAGVGVFDDLRTHSMRCVVTTDGATQDATSTQVSGTVAATAGVVSYYWAAGASIDLCTEIDGTIVSCTGVTESRVPPREVQDAFDAALDAVTGVLGADPLLCPLLGALAPGVPGVVDVKREGDVTVTGIGSVHDCPPYGNQPPGPVLPSVLVHLGADPRL
jgi:hypothetical protein